MLHFLSARTRHPQHVAQPACPHQVVPAQHQVRQHGELVEHRKVLERAGDAHGGHPVGRDPQNGPAPEADLAGLGVVDPGDAVEQRRFAGTVGPDDGEQGPFGHSERDIVQRHQAGKGQGDTVDAQERLAHHDSHRFLRRYSLTSA
jgi:hypothetical protein